MNTFALNYTLNDRAGKPILSESVSGTRIGAILEHIAKKSYEYDQKTTGVSVHVSKFQIAEGKVITDLKKLESVTTMVLIAMEHYNQKSGKLVIESVDHEKSRLTENLKSVFGDPEKTKKFIECWNGYKRVPGTTPYAKGSCEKAKKKKKLVNELELPSLEKGDILLVGKFKNRKAEIKGFSTDDNGQPVAKTSKGDQKIFKPRVAKLIPEKS